MKTTIFTKGLIAGLLLISSVAVAGGNKKVENSDYLNVKVTPLGNKSVYMNFEKLEGEKVQITIYDANGVKVYGEKVKDQTEVKKKYNLSKLPAGKYSFEVANDVYLMKKTVLVK